MRCKSTDAEKGINQSGGIVNRIGFLEFIGRKRGDGNGRNNRSNGGGGTDHIPVAPGEKISV